MKPTPRDLAVAEAVRGEMIRHCTEIGERATMRSVKLHAIIAALPDEQPLTAATGLAISRDPERCGGAPCVAGTRITLARVIAELAEDRRLSEYVDDYYGTVATRGSLVTFQQALRELAWSLDPANAPHPPTGGGE